MVLANRLTRRFGIEHPIVLAPLGQIGGGLLAKAVSEAGGLGVLSGGHDRGWLGAELAKTGDASVGVGFSRNLAKPSALLELALAHEPKAVMLPVDDFAPFVEAVLAAGALLMVEVDTLDQARHVLDLGAEIVVARGVMPFTPQVADLISRGSYDALVLAKGGIADGRGLAAALMLGADGAMMGARFSATKEAQSDPAEIDDLPSAGDLVRRIAAQAAVLLT